MRTGRTGAVDRDRISWTNDQLRPTHARGGPPGGHRPQQSDPQAAAGVRSESRQRTSEHHRDRVIALLATKLSGFTGVGGEGDQRGAAWSASHERLVAQGRDSETVGGERVHRAVAYARASKMGRVREFSKFVIPEAAPVAALAIELGTHA